MSGVNTRWLLGVALATAPAFAQEAAPSGGSKGWLWLVGAVAVVIAVVTARRREATESGGLMASSGSTSTASPGVTRSRGGSSGIQLERPNQPSNADELRVLAEATGLKFQQTDSGACAFLFEADNVGDGVLVIAKINQKGDWVAVYGTVLEKVSDPSFALMRRLMDLNEALWQGKFSIAGSGNIDFQFECPTETLDARELRECAGACAKVIDDFHDELASLV